MVAPQIKSYPISVELDKYSDSTIDIEQTLRRVLSQFIDVGNFEYFYLHHGVTNWLDCLSHKEYNANSEDYSYFRCLPFSKVSVDKQVLVPCKTQTFSKTLETLNQGKRAYLDMSYFFTDVSNLVEKPSLDKVDSMCFGVSKGHALSSARLAFEFCRFPNYKKEVLQKTFTYDIPLVSKEVTIYLKSLETLFQDCLTYDVVFRRAFKDLGQTECASNIIFKEEGKIFPWYLNRNLQYLIL